jgi:hypothetical protein
VLEGQFLSLLGQLQPRPEIAAEFATIAAQVWDAQQEDTEKRTRKLASQLEEQKNLKSELLRAKQRGEVCQSDYEDGNAEFSREIRETEKELRALTRIEMHSCGFVSWRSWTSRRCGEPQMRTNAGEFELSFSRTGFWLVPIARFRTRRTPHCLMC